VSAMESSIEKSFFGEAGAADAEAFPTSGIFFCIAIRVIDHVMTTVGRISAGIDSLTGKNNVIQLSLNSMAGVTSSDA
jgi:hypothetical protein